MADAAPGLWGPPEPDDRPAGDEPAHSGRRGRFVAALAQAVDEKSYVDLTIADILACAGASRRTFYEQFNDKLDCLLAAYDDVVRAPLRAALTAFRQADAWPAQVRAGLAALLTALAERPAETRLWLVESLTAGRPGWRRHERTVARIVPYVDRGREVAPRGVWLPPGLAEATVGSVFAMLRSWVARGETELLPERLPDVTFMALAPFLGPATAAGHARPQIT